MNLEEVRQETIALDEIEMFLKANYELDRIGGSHANQPVSREGEKRMMEALRTPSFFVRHGLPEGALEYILSGRGSELTMHQDMYDASEKEYFSGKGDELDRDRNFNVVRHMRYSNTPFHTHEYIEIAYVMEGECTHYFRMDSQISESHMTKGSVLIIPPGLCHQINIYDDTSMLNILIRTKTFHKAFLSNFPEDNIIFKFFANVLYSDKKQDYILMHTDGDAAVEEMLLMIIREMMEQKPYANRACDRYLELWFLELLRHQTELTGKLSKNQGGYNPTVLSMLIYIEAHYEDVSLAELQEQYHFTPAYINRIFKADVGTSVQKYIVGVKMEKACNLVKKTDMSIADICEKVGYQDQSFFTEQFKKQYGKTPLQMRKSIK